MIRAATFSDGDFTPRSYADNVACDVPDFRHRHVFLSASEVMARYGWGKPKGYQNLKDREPVPPPVMTHPDRWRLDHLLAGEEKRMALAEAALEALVAPDREPTTVTDLLPSPSDDGGQRDAPSDALPETIVYEVPKT